jgi:hypothetical protein
VPVVSHVSEATRAAEIGHRGGFRARSPGTPLVTNGGRKAKMLKRLMQLAAAKRLYDSWRARRARRY